MTIVCPSKQFNNFKPPNIKLVNENIYYLINKSGKYIYDINNNFYGKSTGYSLRPTYKSNGAVEIESPKKKKYWITGNVKYIIDNNYILTNVFKINS